MVDLAHVYYKADRVSLAVPADPADLQNVPWGQKATFNAVVEDPRSVAYMTSAAPSMPISPSETSERDEPDLSRRSPSPDLVSPSIVMPPPRRRPGLESRHSFAGFDGARPTSSTLPTGAPATTRRRPVPTRAKSHLSQKSTTTRVSPPPYRYDDDHRHHQPPPPPSASFGVQAWERPTVPSLSHQYPPSADETAIPTRQEARQTPRLPPARIVPVMQALDYEADPLIDAAGIHRVLERGRVVVLSREYDPWPVTTATVVAREAEVAQTPRPRVGPSASSSSGPSTRHAARASIELASTSLYEDYEQMPSSAWSQSPLPSPAVHSEPAENPFFADVTVDEASFRPDSALSEPYSAQQAIEAIGMDRTRTIVHVPLLHPLLSQPHRAADAGSRPMAIAIVSIASSVVPYPSQLIRSWARLGPHLATSYSLAQHFSDVQSQAVSLTDRCWPSVPPPRPATGARRDGRRPQDLAAAFPMSPTSTSPRSTAPSVGGSLASPGERSPENLVWDPADLGPAHQRHPSDDSAGGLHFAHPFGPDVVDGPLASDLRRAPPAAATTPAVQRVTRGTIERTISAPAPPSHVAGPDPSALAHHVSSRTSKHDPSGPPARAVRHGLAPDPTITDEPGPATSSSSSSSSPPRTDVPLHPRHTPARSTAVMGSKPRRGPGHSLLHSYGADFRSTFQSLPTASGSAGPSRPADERSSPRPASDAAVVSVELPPPSERLLRTMIDAIPVQIFTASPQDGRITWVNSKFLAYRGHSVQAFIHNPWRSIHPDQREAYLQTWGQALRNNEQFSYRVRLRRFDGRYRWFYVRAAPLRDTKGITVHWVGTNMDIHDQHAAELSAARQQETAASESKYRALANSSPQIVFAAADSGGIIFANTQWLHYSGQAYQDALGLGFTEHVHAEDLAKCKLPGLHSHPDPIHRTASSHDRSGRSHTGPGSLSSSSTVSMSTVIAPPASRLDPVPTSDPTIDVAAVAGATTITTEPVKVFTDGDGQLAYSAEIRLRAKDGAYRWHLIRCTKVDSTFLGTTEPSWLGTCTDINDHKVLEQRMTETMESKTRFLSNMSHEIRTPLIGISGMVEFLYQTPLTVEQLDYCETISSSSAGLLSIVNDILDLSKIEAGMMRLSYEWFNVRSIIESVNDALSSQVIHKGLELNYIVEADVPRRLRGDPARIRQVLMNILGNAVKFTNAGEVYAHCHIAHDHELPPSPGRSIVLAFEIIDSGPGFSAREADLIFKPFSQIDASSARQYGGSGLGLVISRQLVELHGGRMTGSSIPGQGSTFRFLARFDVPSTAEAAADDSDEVPPADDDPSSVDERPSRPPYPAPTSPYLSRGFTQSPGVMVVAGGGDGQPSPAVMSSASSDPSVRSLRTARTARSSMSSMTPTVPCAAEGGAGDGSPMKLVLPWEGHVPEGPPLSPSSSSMTSAEDPRGRRRRRPPTTDANLYPRLYSILIVCPQPYSLQAVARHVETSLPQGIPYQVTARSSLLECQRMLGDGDSAVIFTHILVNLPAPDQVVALLDHVFMSSAHAQTSLIILADAMARQEIKRRVRERGSRSADYDVRIQFLNKPIKPSRLAQVFDSGHGWARSAEHIRRSAEKLTDRRKQVFVEMEKSVGHQGHYVLVVEDNPINRKVRRVDNPQYIYIYIYPSSSLLPS